MHIYLDFFHRGEKHEKINVRRDCGIGGVLASHGRIRPDDGVSPPRVSKKDLPSSAFSATASQPQSTTAALFSKQDLADLLWCAMGKNRDDGKLTAPTASNKQEVRLFVFDADGVSEYLPQSHELKQVAKGDNRDLVAGHQDFVKTAPVSLVIVADMDKFGGTEPRQLTMATVDVGIVCENISVAAAGLGLASRPRGTMDSEGISKLLGLNENQLPIMNNVVGYPTKK